MSCPAGRAPALVSRRPVTRPVCYAGYSETKSRTPCRPGIPTQVPTCMFCADNSHLRKSTSRIDPASTSGADDQASGEPVVSAGRTRVPGNSTSMCLVRVMRGASSQRW